jgi:hypothetical protein
MTHRFLALAACAFVVTCVAACGSDTPATTEPAISGIGPLIH